MDKYCQPMKVVDQFNVALQWPMWKILIARVFTRKHFYKFFFILNIKEILLEKFFDTLGNPTNSYHKQSKIPHEPIKLKSRKLVKDNFGRRSNSPKKIIPGSRDHVAQILSPQTKVTLEVTKVNFSSHRIGWRSTCQSEVYSRYF